MTQAQNRNRWSIAVSFPRDWADEPALAGLTVMFWYASQQDALDAAHGFRLRGAVA